MVAGVQEAVGQGDMDAGALGRVGGAGESVLRQARGDSRNTRVEIDIAIIGEPSLDRFKDRDLDSGDIGQGGKCGAASVDGKCGIGAQNRVELHGGVRPPGCRGSKKGNRAGCKGWSLAIRSAGEQRRRGVGGPRVGVVPGDIMAGQQQGEEVLGEPVGVQRFQDHSSVGRRVADAMVGQDPRRGLQLEILEDSGSRRVPGRAGQDGGKHRPGHDTGRGLELLPARSAAIEATPVHVFTVEQVRGKTFRVGRQPLSAVMRIHGDEGRHMQSQYKTVCRIGQGCRWRDADRLVDAEEFGEPVARRLEHNFPGLRRARQRRQQPIVSGDTELGELATHRRPPVHTTTQQQHPGRRALMQQRVTQQPQEVAVGPSVGVIDNHQRPAAVKSLDLPGAVR